MINNVNKGEFFNSLRYIKAGTGNNVVIVLLGGPGDMIVDDRGEKYTTVFQELIDNDYTIYVVARRNNLEKGYSISDIGKDIFDIANHHFNGQINAVIGYSFGGFIVQELAGNFNAISNKYICLGSPYYINDKAHHLDLIMTNSVIKKDYKSAFEKIPEIMYTNPLAINQLKELVNQAPEDLFNLMFNHNYSNFYNDMRIEVELLKGLNNKDLLRETTEEILFIGGTKDMYFTEKDMKDTSNLVKNSQLIMLEGKAHGELLTHETVKIIHHFIKN